MFIEVCSLSLYPKYNTTISCLHIAVLSYYHKNTKDALLYLNKSEEALKETVCHKKIMKARKNIKLLEEIL